MALNYQNYASLGVNLNRQLSGPLDISTVFNSQVDLTYYLTGGTGDKTGVSEYWASLPATYPYAGQIVALATDAGVSVLVIKESESGFVTEPISAETAVDGEVITYNADKELTLVGFADAATGARLQKTATGVEWVVPGSDGTMTDAQVQQAIKDLNRDVTNLGTNLGAVEDIVGKKSTGEGVASTGLIASVEALEAQDGVLAGEIGTLKTGLSNVYTKTETDSAIATAIAEVDHLSREIVETLPENANANVIYMVLRGGGTGQDVYNEYMYINGAWEIIGDTSVDLTDYAKKEDIEINRRQFDDIGRIIMYQNILGYDDIQTFKDYTQILVETFINSLNPNDKRRLRFDGAIYTVNNCFVLPYVFKNANLTTATLGLIILEPNGNMSIWVDDIDNLFKSANFNNTLNVTDLVRLDIYGRCTLFEILENYNIQTIVSKRKFILMD